MTDEEFAALVRRLEGVAKASPRAYRFRVVALAALAYAYVFAAVALALGIVIGLAVASYQAGRLNLGVVKIELALLVVVGGIARALWVRFDPPSGIRLTREDFPKLFERIEAVRVGVGAPPVHAVLFDGAFNASVAQRPRLGVLGWQKNYLCLGLSLMRALSAPQFEAVLAHEFGHLSGAHGRLGGWIYRSRMSWGRLLERMEEQRSWASFVFVPFFRWYAPYFNAYSFVQARTQEYEADRAGARTSGARAMADALLASDVQAPALRAYWDTVGARSRDVPEPDARPYADMRFAPASANAAALVESALAEETSLHDTHPSLRDRLAALGEAPRVPPPVERSAADELLGAGQAALCDVLDRDWRIAARERWRAVHRQTQAARARLAELTAQEDASDDELFERAKLTEDLTGADAALPHYRGVLARDGSHAGAAFAVGRLLLAGGDESGIELLERSIARTHQAILPATEHALRFLRSRGREADVAHWLERARAHHRKLTEAEEERSSVSLDAQYDAAGLDSESLGRLVLYLREHPDVALAWIVRRRVRHFPESPLFVLGVRRKQGIGESLRSAERKRRDLELQKALTGAPVPGKAFVLVLNHRPQSYTQLFTAVGGSEIFARRS
jgi:Zn-dependent protease with chaperone function